MPIFTIVALVLLVLCVVVHHVSSGVAAISLRGKPASRDELFVRGATQLFGPPLYLRARFLLPWVHPKTLDGQPEEIRRTVAVARFSGMSAVAALALLLAALEHARAHAH